MRSKLRRWLARRGLLPQAEQTLDLGPVRIVLPPGHALPNYLRRHPRYDRFLPHLAHFLEVGSTVVDVGANCGDTLAAMACTNPKLRYLCIEPDAGFFVYLERNLARLREAFPTLDAVPVQALVGKAVAHATLEGRDGTKHARPGGPGGLASTTLDAIVMARGAPRVSLLKSDVDGFDHDVLDSARELIGRDQPLLFFECHPVDATQREGYQRLMPSLGDAGYTRFTVFDNFGQPMLADAGVAQTLQLLDYVERMERGPSTRTIYYVDVLACTARDTGLVTEVLASY